MFLVHPFTHFRGEKNQETLGGHIWLLVLKWCFVYTHDVMTLMQASEIRGMIIRTSCIQRALYKKMTSAVNTRSYYICAMHVFFRDAIDLPTCRCFKWNKFATNLCSKSWKYQWTVVTYHAKKIANIFSSPYSRTDMEQS